MSKTAELDNKSWMGNVLAEPLSRKCEPAKTPFKKKGRETLFRKGSGAARGHPAFLQKCKEDRLHSHAWMCHTSAQSTAELCLFLKVILF